VTSYAAHPGIDVPAATEANILHAAAFLEFKQHVERLAREGQDLAAYTCWTHAVGIRHSPFVIPITSEFSLPWSKCLAASEIVNVAQVRLEGSSSLGLGLWSSGAAGVSSFHPMFSRKMLGRATMSSKRKWISFSWTPIGGPVLAADDGELGMGKLFEAWPTTMASPPSSSRGDPG